MSEPVEEPFYFAAQSGFHDEVLSLLKDNPGLDVNWTSPADTTALHLASWHDRVEVVKVLLAHPDISVNLKDISGTTPLSCACRIGHVSVVELFLKDPRVDLTLTDNDHRTSVVFFSEGKTCSG